MEYKLQETEYKPEDFLYPGVSVVRPPSGVATFHRPGQLLGD